MPARVQPGVNLIAEQTKEIDVDHAEIVGWTSGDDGGTSDSTSSRRCASEPSRLRRVRLN